MTSSAPAAGSQFSSSQSSGDAHAVRCELANGVLRSTGGLRLRVTGWSMLPTIWPGDLLVVEPTVDDFLEGDIITFSSGSRFVAHRVVAKTSGPGNARVRTQGDAVRIPDSPVSGSDVLGKVSLIVRNGRTISPRRNLHFPERAAAALLRRSALAVRIAVGVHGIRQSSRAANRNLTPTNHV